MNNYDSAIRNAVFTSYFHPSKSFKPMKLWMEYLPRQVGHEPPQFHKLAPCSTNLPPGLGDQFLQNYFDLLEYDC